MGVLDADLRRQGDTVGRLRHRLQGAVLDAVHGREEQSGPREGQPGQQVPAGVGGPDLLGDGPVHGSRVEPLLDEERGRTGDLVTGHDRVLHRGGAAPRGEQREVQVDPAVGGDVQGDPGQQRPVGHHGAAVGADLPQARQELLVPRSGRLQHLDPGLRRPLGDRARDEPPPSPGGRVGPRDDGGHLVPPGGDQGVQSGNGDLGGTCEDELHGWRLASRAGILQTPRARRRSRGTGQRTSLCGATAPGSGAARTSRTRPAPPPNPAAHHARTPTRTTREPARIHGRPRRKPTRPPRS